MIKNTSLHQANIVIVFDEGIHLPENSWFTDLFGGSEASGMNFIDDPAMATKILHVPQRGLMLVWEGRRLRIDDQQARDPGDSPLPKEAARIESIIKETVPSKMIGYGFNFDLYYQTRDAIRITDFLRGAANQDLDMGSGLLDVGIQWTTMEKDGKEIRGYFAKVTAPLEFALHYNREFRTNALPKQYRLEEQMTQTYAQANQVAKLLHW